MTNKKCSFDLHDQIRLKKRKKKSIIKTKQVSRVQYKNRAEIANANEFERFYGVGAYTGTQPLKEDLGCSVYAFRGNNHPSHIR